MIKSGVDWYTKGLAVVEVSFPEDDVRCRNCRFCRPEKEAGRFWCRLTNEIIYNIDAMDGRCPIQFLEEEKSDEQDHIEDTQLPADHGGTYLRRR